MVVAASKLMRDFAANFWRALVTARSGSSVIDCRCSRGSNASGGAARGGLTEVIRQSEVRGRRGKQKSAMGVGGIHRYINQSCSDIQVASRDAMQSHIS